MDLESLICYMYYNYSKLVVKKKNYWVLKVILNAILNLFLQILKLDLIIENFEDAFLLGKTISLKS